MSTHMHHARNIILPVLQMAWSVCCLLGLFCTLGSAQFLTQKTPEFRILHLFSKILGVIPEPTVEGATPFCTHSQHDRWHHAFVFSGIILASETARSRSQPFRPRSLIAVFSLSSIRPTVNIVFSHVACNLRSWPTPVIGASCSLSVWKVALIIKMITQSVEANLL